MRESLLLSPLLLNTYAYLDEASGQTKRKLKTSRSAIIVCGQDDLGRVFTLYSWADRVRPTEIVEQVIKAHTLYHPKLFGIESNAQQNLFAELLTELIHREGIQDFSPAYIKPPLDTTKIERIKNAVQPYMKSGRLFLREEIDRELKREIDTFPTGQTNDLIDALAGCLALIPPIYEPRKNTFTHDAIREYLKQQGMSEQELARIPQFFPSFPLTPDDDPLRKITRERFIRS